MPLVTIKIAATDDASKTIDRIKGKLATLNTAQTGGDGLGIDIKGLDQFAGILAGGGIGGLLAGVGVGAGVVALGAMSVEMARTGAAAEALGQSFGAMATQAGQDSAAMLAAMREASAGTIADTDLMLSANRAMSYGVADNAQEMTQLIQLSMAQAAKMGIPVQQAFNDLVTGVGRLSPMILDNLGVTVSAEKAYAAYAASVGKAADQLSEAEKRQAFLNEMMRAAPDAALEAGKAADSNAAAFARMDTSLKNFTDQLGILLAGPLAALADGVADAADGVTEMVVKPEQAKAVIELTRRMEELQAQRDALTANQAQTSELPFASGQFFAEGAAEWDKPPLEIDTSAAEAKLASLDAQIRALQLLISGLNESPGAMGQMQADRFMADFAAGQASFQAIGAEAAATADAAAQAVSDSFANIQSTMVGQIGSLTKGLVDEMGALAALDLNDSLISEMNTLIAHLQAAGISAELTGYLMVEWLNNEATAAKAAAQEMKELAGATSTTAARQAAATSAIANMTRALRSQVGALRAANEAARDTGRTASTVGSRLAELVGSEAQGRNDRMAAGFSAMADGMYEFAGSVGGGGGAADAMSSLQSQVDSVLSGALNVDVGVNTSSFLPREDAINEDARRLADVMVNGFGSPWASYFESEFPALFQQMTAGGDIQAGAARMLQEFEAGLRPELINQDLVKERVKAMIIGDANMAALAQEITSELQAELGNVDPASVAAMVNGALGIQGTGVGAGIEDELGNAALIGKIQATGTTGGKAWGAAFLGYVESNVPAALVGLLVDLVTPGVRAKITEEASAGGAV